MERTLFLSRPFAAIGLLLAAGAHAGTVTNTDDSGMGSLREVLASASGGETITFSLTLPATIVLTTGELPITQSVTIEGPGADLLTISNANGRVFDLDTSAKDVTLSGLHLSGQNPSGDGGAIINNGGNLTIAYSLIDGSSCPGEGGAIRNNYNAAGNSLTIQNSTIAGNTANKSGGLYFIGYALTIENSTIAGNHATDSSGAIGLFSGFAFIYNSTIAGNSANLVGGITSQDSQLTFESTIVANNTDITGINDLNRTGSGNGSFVDATNSLFSETFQPADNVLNGATVVGNMVGVDPQLNALTDNGGTTPTMRPGGTSPALGNGVNLHAYVYDQRGVGFPRDADPSGATGDVDIGAIQRYAPSQSAHLTVTLDDSHEHARYGQVLDYVLTISNAGPADADDIDISEMLPAEFDGAFAQWICIGGNAGASCTASGSGPLSDTNVVIPESRSLTWLISVPVLADATGATADNSVEVASFADPDAPYDVTDSDILVVLRDGFDMPYADGTGDGLAASTSPAASATDAAGSTLAAGQSMSLAMPAVRAAAAVDTLLRARGEDGSGFRVDRLNLGTRTQARLVTVDPSGVERPGPWAQAAASARLTLALTTDGKVTLQTPVSTLEMALAGRSGQAYRIELSTSARQ